MNRAEKLEELLSTKAFDELTWSEKELVLSELGSEEQYEVMRKIGNTLMKGNILTPDPQIIKSLQQKMRDEKRTSVVYQLLSWQAPAYVTVFMVAACCTFTWFVTKKSNPSPLVTIVKTDTVYLASQPDTIFREKVIYRYVKPKVLFTQNVTKTETTTPVRQPEITGVSMKANEALEKFLVSGSK